MISVYMLRSSSTASVVRAIYIDNAEYQLRCIGRRHLGPPLSASVHHRPGEKLSHHLDKDMATGQWSEWSLVRVSEWLNCVQNCLEDE